ncbi:MAG: hypothetical protein Q7V04_05295 [Deltaproteobacteria bacterium]|nr:hypothetical protein [Deltaproteobacteria bacterium]
MRNLLSILIVSILVMAVLSGCQRYESESKKQLDYAKTLLCQRDKTLQDYKKIENHLKCVDSRSSSYKEAMEALKEVDDHIKEKEKANVPVVLEASQYTRQELKEVFSHKWLTEFRTATEISFKGENKRTMKVKVNFQADQANKVIHDYSLIATAKKAGIKRIEFHDWSGFSKEYLSHDIQ